ncbi:MAG: Glucosamine-6-phosphate deaminase 1 [Phycisphaerae bacterium]|nr:Glucosamine-6-phosphate deaminase 1 [Phycisphaerae bacterium]
MRITISKTKQETGRAAAREGAYLIRRAIDTSGVANIVVATGLGQIDMYEALLREPGIDWTRVVGFHLDEYVGLPPSHPASFRYYLAERFVSKVSLRAFHYVDGNASLVEECRRLNQLILSHPIDVAFIGIGENGHLAFNDPPADFDTNEPFIVVQMDNACRQQQVNEGWFRHLDEVPTRAISMSISQIMASRSIVCTTPDARKAAAVHNALNGPVTPTVPASILQQHVDATIHLDRFSAGLLSVVNLWTVETAASRQGAVFQL